MEFCRHRHRPPARVLGHSRIGVRGEIVVVDLRVGEVHRGARCSPCGDGLDKKAR